MAQVKEQNPAQAQNNPNRNSESGGESVPAPAALIITGGPAVLSSPRRPLCPSTSTRWVVWVKWART